MINLEECREGQSIKFLERAELEAAFNEYYNHVNSPYRRAVLSLAGESFPIKEIDLICNVVVLEGNDPRLFASTSNAWLFRSYMFESIEDQISKQTNETVPILFGKMSYSVE